MSKYRLFPQSHVVASEVDKLVSAFVAAYNKLKLRYPQAGLGDTASDEEVVAHLYAVLHFGEPV